MPKNTPKRATKATSKTTKPKVKPRAKAKAKPKAEPTIKAVVKTAPVQKEPTGNAPTFEQISALAFEIWIRKGRPIGRDRENWLEAEAELNLTS